MSDKAMLKQAFILTAGNIISRFLGLIYIFPFAWLVGQEGQALFSYAYVPYAIFIDLATLGIPLGVAKFISIYNAQNDYVTSYNIFKRSTIFMLIIGIMMFLMMFLLAKPIAYQVLGGESEITNNVKDVTNVIRIIASALIVVPSIALLRGFFQGFKLPKSMALSQVVEQITRVLFIIVSSFFVIKVFNLDYTIAVYFAVSAATIASIAAYVLLRVHLHKFFKRLKGLLKTSVTSHNKTTKELFKELLRYAIPIALFGLVTSLYLFIDTLTFNKAYLLRGEVNPEIIYGTYAFEINKLIMIPVSLGMGLGVSMLVYISESYTKGYYKIVNKQILKAIQICTFIILPIVALMMIFKDSLYSFFYSSENIYGPSILLAYAPLALIIGFNHITCSVMQAINKQNYLLITMLLGVSLKYLYNEPLIQSLGYNGAILGTFIGLMVTIIANFLIMEYTIRFKHLYMIRRLLIIFGVNLVVSGILVIFNFVIFEININLASRFQCLLFLSINGIIYVILYLCVSYIIGLFDVVFGKEFKLKKLLLVIKNKYVTNQY